MLSRAQTSCGSSLFSRLCNGRALEHRAADVGPVVEAEPSADLAAAAQVAVEAGAAQVAAEAVADQAAAGDNWKSSSQWSITLRELPASDDCLNDDADRFNGLISLTIF